MTVCRVDHQHVGSHRQQGLGLGGRVSVDADRDSDPQAAVGVDRGLIDGRAKGALAGDAPDQSPGVIDNGSDRQSLAAEALEDLVGRSSGFDHHQITAHHVLQLAEAVESHCVVLGEDPNGRAIVAHDDERTMGALVDQAERVAHGVSRAERDRRVVQDVT